MATEVVEDLIQIAVGGGGGGGGINVVVLLHKKIALFIIDAYTFLDKPRNIETLEKKNIPWSCRKIS